MSLESRSSKPANKPSLKEKSKQLTDKQKQVREQLKVDVSKDVDKKLNEYQKDWEKVDKALKSSISRIGIVKDRQGFQRLCEKYGRGLIMQHGRNIMKERYEVNYRINRGKIDKYLKRLVKYYDNEIPDAKLYKIRLLFGSKLIDSHLQLIRLNLAEQRKKNSSGMAVYKRMDKANAKRFAQSPLAAPLKVGKALEAVGEAQLKKYMQQCEEIAKGMPDMLLLMKYMGIELPVAIRGLYEGVVIGFNNTGVELGNFAGSLYLEPKATMGLLFSRLKVIANKTLGLATNPSNISDLIKKIRTGSVKFAEHVNKSNGKNFARLVGQGYAYYISSAVISRGLTGLEKATSLNQFLKGLKTLDKANPKIKKISRFLYNNLRIRRAVVEALLMQKAISPEFYSAEKITRVTLAITEKRINTIKDPQERETARRKILEICNTFPFLPLAKRKSIVEAFARTFLTGNPNSKDRVIVSDLMNQVMGKTIKRHQRAMAKAFNKLLGKKI